MEISEIEFSLYLDEKILEFLPERNVQERLHQYLEIEPPRAVLQIEQVVTQTADHLLQRIRIAVVERGIRGHPRTDLVQETIAGIAFHDLVNVELALRTGADEGQKAVPYTLHVTLEGVHPI